MPMFQRNEQSDLPLPSRTNDIIAEARQRLAASGGKASMLPQMIEKVTQEFRRSDEMRNSNDKNASQRFEMPNNMENYIDRVLQMSGMMDDPNAASGGALPDSGPIPPDRPLDNASADPSLPDGAPIPAANPNGEGDGSNLGTFGMLAAGLLGVGGVAAAAKWLNNRYGKNGTSTPLDDAANVAKSTVDQSIDEIDGANTTPKQARIEGENRPQLEGPRTAIAGPQSNNAVVPANPIDESIDSTMTQDEIDQRIQGAVEGRTGNGMPPSSQSRFAPSSQNFQIIKDAADMLDQGDVRGAFKLMQDNGVQIDEEMMRRFATSSNTAKSLASRAGIDAASRAAGSAVRNSVR